ncbi:carbohydrate ABC transporter permease [Demequina pelophila]|uniref:carbohydrate ABC transporter permease n=1 Tax=Demequina pelophila TaxID=1638984 RepID=UPI0009E1E49B|nr:sugar ABC transporter permease [Demequina pelophila]
MTDTMEAPARRAAVEDEGASPRRFRLPHLSHRRGDLIAALFFVAPATLGLAVFLVWPTLRGIYFSFTDYNVFTPAQWVGLDNYVRMVQDPEFWHSMWVTVQYVLVNIGVQTVLAVLLAVLMHRLTRSVFVRSVMLTPFLVSNVVVGLVWLWILDYQLGIGNKFLEWIGIGRVFFWGDDKLVIPTLALITVWKFLGYTALLIFAGLQTIPEQLYEAGRLDGASEGRMFRSITLPLLRPYLAMVVILSIIGSFQVFDLVSVTTGGGPVNASQVIQMEIYKAAFGRFEFGYASAMSVALMLVLLVITFLQYRLSRAGSSDLA